MPKPDKYASPHARPAPQNLEICPKRIRPTEKIARGAHRAGWSTFVWFDEAADMPAPVMGDGLIRALIRNTNWRIEQENAEHRRRSSQQQLARRYETEF